MPPKKVKKNKVAAEKQPAPGKPRTLKPVPQPAEMKVKSSKHARIDPASEPQKHESGKAGKMKWANALGMATNGGRRASNDSVADSQWTSFQPPEQQKKFQHWDLALLVDSDHVSQDAAREEVEKLFVLLKKEGVQLSTALPIDDDEGWEGQVLALATATQSEFEEEAEMMGMSKPLKLGPEIAERFKVDILYGRVTAPFTVAKRDQFHKSPFVIRNLVMEQGDGEGQDSSRLEYFSYVERQFLLEHMIEHRIRQLISQKELSPQTRVIFFPLHEATGEEAKRFKGVHLRKSLQARWATFSRWERYRSVFKIWGNPAEGLNEPLDDIRNYFGSQIAMYVGFLSFYTRWLVYPAIVGLFFQIWSFFYGFDTFGLVVCCAFICLWSALMIQFWIRKEASLAFSWFTHDPLSFDPKVRRDFYIAMDKYERGGRPHTMMGRLMTGMSKKSDWTDEKIQADEMKAEDFTFPLWVRAKLVSVSVILISLFLASAVIIFVYMYLINVVAAWTNCQFGVVAGSILHALMIIAVGLAYRVLAVKLNDWENHRTEDDYENNFILKVFLFEFVNNFLSMIWIAFLSFRYCSRLEEIGQLLPIGGGVSAEQICLLDGVEQCEEVFREKVVQELQIKLATLFLTRLVVSNIIESKVIQRFVERFLAAKQRAAEEVEKARTSLPSVDHVSFGMPASLAAKYSRKNTDASKLQAPAAAQLDDEHASTPPLEKVSRDPDVEEEEEERKVVAAAADSDDDGGEAAAVGRSKVKRGTKSKEEKQKEAKSRWAVVNGVWAIAKPEQRREEDKKGSVGGYGWWVCKGREESTMPVYGDMEEAQTVDDYNELVMQFSFVCLFGVAFPVVAMLALISNLVEMVVDAKKLCFNSRRPFAQRASGIPQMWLKILKCVCAFGVVTNVVIVLTNSSLILDWLEIDTDGASFWTAAFVFEHILVGLIILFWQIVPDEPRAITKLQILSRRIQRAMLLNRQEEARSQAAPGSPRNDPILDSKAIFNRPDVDDEEYYYIPSKQAQARAATGRRRSST